MPARTTVAHEGEYYHVYNRGALRMTLFFTPFMYGLFLKLLTEFAEKCHISIIAFCLMPNHFHLLIRVEKGGSVDQFMQRLCSGYSRKINRYLSRAGTVFQGRYHIKHVANDNYFKSLCRYIHLNPVKSALAEFPSGWEYSNYLECLGKRASISGQHHVVSEMFGGASFYEAFVHDGLGSGPIDNAELAADLAEMHAL
ncbi:MAG: transposase [Ignavibacteria bacterium]|nr:transposase [Ignavibacteria bacterium]MBK6419793.1 transposase [Ignavibacteria bacterium]MBK6759576.1 transposase [Ignavibacteria bacterium]MBK7033239.1 transposase [Ignavibacteria bacterium]MBK7184466.1 transposase [Ignavibacteria bacterium]